MAPFWRGYTCVDKGSVYEVEYEFNGKELKVGCTCYECNRKRICRHIGKYLSEPPMSEVIGKYPMKIERLRK